MEDLIQRFFDGGPFAVVGASNDRSKFGNRVFRAYLDAGLKAFPINPKADEIEGHTAYASLADLPQRVLGVSIITPPKVTERVVEEAAAASADIVWMQPGAESDLAIELAGDFALDAIAGGPCVLVELPKWLRRRS